MNPEEADPLGAGGRWFKSTRPDHSFQSLPRVFCLFVYSTVVDFVDGEILKLQYEMESFGPSPHTFDRGTGLSTALKRCVKPFPCLAGGFVTP